MDFKKSIQKYNIGDRVGTNIHYMCGFDSHTTPPSDLRRLNSLKVIKVIEGEPTPAYHYSHGKKVKNWGESFIYECKGRTKTYIINQCFLEKL